MFHFMMYYNSTIPHVPKSFIEEGEQIVFHDVGLDIQNDTGFALDLIF